MLELTNNTKYFIINKWIFYIKIWIFKKFNTVINFIIEFLLVN